MIRYKVESDSGFIHSSWITNLHSAEPYVFIPWDIFCKHQDQLIEDLNPFSKTLVYCLAEDPNIALGYLCYSHLQDNLIIHFGYVKEKLRNNNVMTELLEAADPNYKSKLIALTHISKAYRSLSKKYQIFYDPFIINTLQQLYKEPNDS